jgi:hypothetical protein
VLRVFDARSLAMFFQQIVKCLDCQGVECRPLPNPERYSMVLVFVEESARTLTFMTTSKTLMRSIPNLQVCADEENRADWDQRG